MRVFKIFFNFFVLTIAILLTNQPVYAGNTFETATSVSLNTECTGTLTSSSKDFYSFKLDSSGRIDIEHSNFSTNNGHYKLYDNQYKEIKSFYGPYDSNRGYSYDIDYCYLTAGIYYLQVYDCEGQYIFNVKFTNSDETFVESQTNKYDYIGEAKSVSLGTTVKGQLGLNDSQDIYTFNLMDAGSLSIEHTNYSKGGNHYEILDTNGTSKHSFYGPYDNNKGYGYDIDTYTLDKGLYYIKVSDSDGFYNFKITINKKTQIISGIEDIYSKITTSSDFSLGAKTSGNGLITYSSDNENVAYVDKISGKVIIKGAGKANITVNASATDQYLEASRIVTIDVKKDNQTIVVKTSQKRYNKSNLRRAKKSFAIGAKSSSPLSYSVINGKKYISVTKKGKVTVKKGTPKGTYKVKVTAKETWKYLEATKIIKIKVK